MCITSAIFYFCLTHFKMIYSKFRPAKTQSMPFLVVDYLLQVAVQLSFVGLWWYFGYIGVDSLRGQPIPVSVETTKEHSEYKYDSAGYLLHLLLFVFVSAHQTMSIQQAHVTHVKFNPFTRICLASMIFMIVCIIIHFISK
jgi:hypothetical protein